MQEFCIDTKNSRGYILSLLKGKRLGAGVPPGLQIQWQALIKSVMGSTPIRFRQQNQ